MKQTGWLMIFVVLLLTALTVSCSQSEFNGLKRNYVGNNTLHQISGSYGLLDGTQTKTIGVKAGDALQISYNSTVEKGSLTLALLDTEGNSVIDFPVDTSGEAYTTAQRSGDYKLVIKGEDNQGSFDISWEIK